MSIDELLTQVSKPSRYLGNEYNVIKKDWHSVDFRIVLAFPDLYEIGMSHLGLKILYHILNDKEKCLAERLYTPDIDFEKLLRQHNEPLFSLESRRPVRDFDVLGITLPYELCYTNILTMLDLAKIPFYAKDREDGDPLVIGGGPCAFHPEPIADFFDAILLGDGEQAVVAIANCLIAAKKAGLVRAEVLEKLSMIPGVYIPSYFRPNYDEQGKFSVVEPLKEGYCKVTKAVLADLDSENYEVAPLVPLTSIVHDRLGLEIARGCTRGCRFCQAGIIYRPVRERKPQSLMELARHGIDKGGFEELALLSLSTGDYSCISGLLTALMDNHCKDNVSISMPSMRVGTLTQDIMEQIQRVRKTGFTIAPEAGTDRLRRFINKGITEEDLLETCKTSFALGWKIIKLYFMCGLPSETEEDLDAIPLLLKKALAIAGPGSSRKINASIGVFVPKPHTPFQWEPQLSVEEGFDRIFDLKGKMPKGVTLKWNDPKLSFLEGVFSRGDRKLSRVIEEAWRAGARLDSWSEHFNLYLWQEAAEKCGIDFTDYLARRELDDPLPWQHLSSGVDEDFFRLELQRAMTEEYTPDCRVHGCQKCGLCDFKTVKPVTHFAEKNINLVTNEVTVEKNLDTPAAIGHFYYHFKYIRTGNAKFIGHLELLRAILRAMNRIDLPLNYSQGFHPMPKVSFGPALPVGTESLAEYFIADFFKPLSDLPNWQIRMNQEMPTDMKVIDISMGGKKSPEKLLTAYEITIHKSVSVDSVSHFMAAQSYSVELIRKGKLRHLDVRPMVEHMELTGDILHLELLSETSKPSIKPIELVIALFNLSTEEKYKVNILKSDFKVLK